MTVGDVEHDRPRLEQGEITFLIGRDLPKWLEREMRAFLHRTERDKANLIRLTYFFKRPANARIPRQAPAAIWGPFKGGNHHGHRETPPCGLVRCETEIRQGKRARLQRYRATSGLP